MYHIYLQVAEPGLSMAFDPEIGERAMLIRNVGGDWGLCIGSWEKGTYWKVHLDRQLCKN